MNGTPAPNASHAAHDEMLIARLYGGDVSDGERERALSQLADCEECASLFADLGAITAAMPAAAAPARPRDFTLTEAQAVRLRPRRFPAFAGWTRPLGAALSGIGAAVLALVAVVSMLPAGAGGAPPAFTNEQNRGAAGPAAASAAIAVNSPLSPNYDACPPVCASAATGGGQAAVATAAGTAAVATAQAPISASQPADNSGPVASLAGGAGGKVVAQGTGHVAPTVAPVPSPAQAGSESFDGRIAVAAAAVLMLLAGLMLLGGSFLARRMQP